MRRLALGVMVFGVAFSLACMKHSVDVRSREPIVIKVEARIDVYNHAAEIEDMVSGKQPMDLPEEEGGSSSFLFDPFASSAYAGERRGLRKAVARRKERYGSVQELKRRGIAGENILGYLAVRSKAAPHQKILIKKENEDRKIIYAETARERGVPLKEVQRGFSGVLRKRAEPGMWIETESGWVRK